MTRIAVELHQQFPVMKSRQHSLAEAILPRGFPHTVYPHHNIDLFICDMCEHAATCAAERRFS